MRSFFEAVRRWLRDTGSDSPTPWHAKKVSVTESTSEWQAKAVSVMASTNGWQAVAVSVESDDSTGGIRFSNATIHYM